MKRFIYITMTLLLVACGSSDRGGSEITTPPKSDPNNGGNDGGGTEPSLIFDYVCQIEPSARLLQSCSTQPNVETAFLKAMHKWRQTEGFWFYKQVTTESNRKKYKLTVKQLDCIKRVFCKSTLQ